MDESINELKRLVLEGGDIEALRRLISALARAGRAGEIARVVRQFLAAFPERAAQVLEILQGSTLTKQTARRPKAIAKLVQKLGKLAPKLPKPRPESGGGGGWALLRNVGKLGYRFAYNLVLRGVATFGAVGFIVLMLLIIAAIAITIYLFTRNPHDAVSCDCTRVTAGFLTKEHQNQCRTREQKLLDWTKGCRTLQCIRDKLKLTIGPGGTLIRGEFCDSVAHGLFGWPVAGGPVEPPARPADEEECKGTSGISRKCN